MNLTVVVGNPKPESRTLGVALAAAEAAVAAISKPFKPAALVDVVRGLVA